jgi:hypothetical protein
MDLVVALIYRSMESSLNHCTFNVHIPIYKRTSLLSILLLHLDSADDPRNKKKEGREGWN